MMGLHDRDLEHGLTGEDVAWLQAALRCLGQEIETAEQDARRFGDSTQAALRAIQTALGLEPTGVVDKTTGVRITDAVQNTTYAVAGVVTSTLSASLAGLTVQLVDVNVAAADTPLASATTDGRGAYAVSAVVSPADLTARHKARPDLQVQVLAAGAKVGASVVRYQASTNETLNVDLTVSAGLISEHETLLAAIGSAYTGPLANLLENDERQDITFLANRTGWDARAVALATQADLLASTKTDAGAAIAAPFYYVLLRAGLPADAPTLFQANPQTVGGLWSQAVEQGMIPAGLQSEIPAALETFQTLSAATLLTAPPQTGLSTLKEMVSLSLPDAVQQQTFVSLYAAHRHSPADLWTATEDALGADVARTLQLHGQLFALTLNNAPLAAALLRAETGAPIASTLDLATRGYHDPAKWASLIGTAVPSQIPGATTAEKAANYADLMAAQVRLAFPTAVLASLVGQGSIPVLGDGTVALGVERFLTTHQGQFEIGLEAVEGYIARAKVSGTPQAVVDQIKRIQRVYQITPDDKSMAALLGQGLDSAFAIARHQPDGFVRTYADMLGGADVATSIHARAKQIYGSVLNLATAFLTARVAPAIGSPQRPLIAPPPSQIDGGAYPLIAYPTLQGLFGSMDYCDCQACRSILSPAAYFVDLLHFLDNPTPTAPALNPQDVLLARRPDLQNLALTCANTNTALPYIDIVNETVEYFVANGMSIAGYTGHDTDDTATSANLIASPQYVNDAAYAALEQVFFPAPLPFNRPLELLRRHLKGMGVALPDLMIALRPGDAIERGTVAYGWRDILMEAIGLSREEYRLFTDPTLKLHDLYGYPALSDPQVLSKLQTLDLQDVSRRLAVTYDDLFDVLKTRFVNPNAVLIPRLQRLNAAFASLAALKADPSGQKAAFIANLPAGLDARLYGGAAATDYDAVVAWATDATNYARIMGLIVVSNPTDPSDLCSPQSMQFRYANPDNSANLLSATDFLKLIRFIRLWRKLGLSIEQTDQILTALYPAADLPSGTNGAANRAKLDQGFLTLLPRIGVLYQLMSALGLNAASDLAPLLACWSPIGVVGEGSLYAAMFLTPTMTQLDGAFMDDGYGDVLTSATEPLLHHEATLRAAFKLTGAEFDLIIGALGYNAATILTLDNISAIYRLGWFAHALKLSVREYLLLTRFSGLNPFAPLDPLATAPAEPPAVRLVRLVKALAKAGLAPVRALYLLWNQDISGASAPAAGAVIGLARTLRADFASVEAAFSLVDDPDGSIAKSLMTLVYGADATDLFFGFLNNTLLTQAPYSSALGALAQPILDAAPGRLTYDDLRKQIAYAGVLDSAAKTAIDAAVTANGNDPALHAALNTLDTANHRVVDPFFTAYPELQPMFAAYASSSDPAPAKRTRLLAGILPALKNRRKQEQALSEATAAAGVDASFASALLNNASVLPSATGVGAGVIDLTAIEAPGLSAAFFLGDDPTAQPDLAIDSIATTVLAPGVASTGLTLALAGRPTTGDVLTTTLNGIDIAYTVKAVDTDLTLLATAIAGAVNAATTVVLPANKPINALIAATALGPTISLNPIGAAGAFTASLSVSAGATEVYRADGQLPAAPGGAAIAATLGGFLDCPQDGFYDLYVAADAGASVTLSIAGAPVAVAATNGVWSNQSPISLQAGTPVQIQVTATGLHSRLSLSWASTGLGLQPIPAAYLYGASLVHRLRTTFVRFLKATSLAGALSLDAAEIADLALPKTLPVATTCAQKLTATGAQTITPSSMSHIHPGSRLILDSGANAEMVTVTTVTATSFDATTTKLHDGSATPFPIVGEAIDRSWLSILPVDADPTAADAAVLADALWAALGFSRIKKALSPGDERLLQVLQNPAATLADGTPAVLALTGWSQASLTALLGQFYGAATPSNLAPIGNFRRVFDAYAMVTACKISAADLIAATTNDPTAAVMSQLQSALRALYAAPDWLTVVQPINDDLRRLQRDALVAHVLQALGDSADPALAAIDTADKLFEYLLVDVETEPPVLTSRIRLALSSTQLFIERVLRNLETNVSPLDIGSAHWPWMKRYRVWQANREVFLWPENWLYPELRDDQSPFFTQMMSSLLQSDITDDAAANAYLDYLTSLESVAKLEPCGLHYVSPTDKTNAAAYVVARTAGAHRKYYFRRMQDGGWTPWTEMKLDCEDLPVTPVIWNGRLFVFWLKVLKETPVASSSLPTADNGATTLNNQTIGNLQRVANANAGPLTKVTVKAALCWSEFYNGKWQPTKTSDLSRPASLGGFDPVGPGAFDRDRNLLRLEPIAGADELADALVLKISSPLVTTVDTGFILYNTHSLPVLWDDYAAPSTVFQTLTRSLQPIQTYTGANTNTHNNIFSIFYWSNSARSIIEQYGNEILRINDQSRFVEPQYDAKNPFDAPFFYEDRKYVFYVTTSEEIKTTPLFSGYGLAPTTLINFPVAKLPPVVLRPPPRFEVPGGDPEPFRSTVGGDPTAAAQYLAGAPNLQVVLGSGLSVNFGGVAIGPAGSAKTVAQTAANQQRNG